MQCTCTCVGGLRRVRIVRGGSVCTHSSEHFVVEVAKGCGVSRDREAEGEKRRGKDHREIEIQIDKLWVLFFPRRRFSPPGGQRRG